MTANLVISPAGQRCASNRIRGWLFAWMQKTLAKKTALYSNPTDKRPGLPQPRQAVTAGHTERGSMNKPPLPWNIDNQPSKSTLDDNANRLGVELAAYYVSAGFVSFKDHANEMLKELGDAARPHLKTWYLSVLRLNKRYAAQMDDETAIASLAQPPRFLKGDRVYWVLPPGNRRSGEKDYGTVISQNWDRVTIHPDRQPPQGWTEAYLLATSLHREAAHV
ncbi:MAG: hypothetical protein ACREUA_03940 [Burkholderiales bacterium]